MLKYFFIEIMIPVICIVVPVGVLIFGSDYVAYWLNKAECNLYVEEKFVWSGRCHFIDINSIGENGNTKEVIVYEDVIKFRPIKKYVDNDIKVTERKH